MNIHVETVETSALGDRSYLAHDGETGVVIDPQRDIDRFIALVGRLGVRLTHVAETHLHNDYVSGGLTLAQATGATYLTAAEQQAAFPRRPVRHGEHITISPTLRLTVHATPGHTFHHLSYIVEEEDQPIGVFTGGSLLFGTTGRTDLLGFEHARELALRQHASARSLADALPDEAHVWPTHGFGSFCAAHHTETRQSTIGQEKHTNPALRMDADEFAAHLLDSLDDYPTYYTRMAPRNIAGAELIDLTPLPQADEKELHQRIQAREWVIDLRPRTAFAHRHLTGTVNLGLDGAMATWLGWILPENAPLTLLGESHLHLATAQRELARIGIDRPTAVATGTPEAWAGGEDTLLNTMPTATFADLAAVLTGNSPHNLPAPDAILDVRTAREWRQGHLRDAVHIPLPDLAALLNDPIAGAAEIPDGTIWTHCSSGYRAVAAASLLTRADRHAVAVDDSYTEAASAGLPITRPRQ